jgi:mono/diheme cytochrome c family protein
MSLAHRTQSVLCAMVFLMACVGTATAQGESTAPALIARGKALATAADCVACHSEAGGKPFAGGLKLATPLGPIVASNITPSTTAGIGKDTLAQFSRALRQGIRADGSHLYPAMPYTAYAKLSDDDIGALYAYFMHGVAPVDTPAPQTKLPFPFNIRRSMALWNAVYLDGKPFAAPSGASPEVARGAYLAEALAHCDTCHTPRGFLMGPKNDQALAGGSLGTWYAPNITSDVNSGIGGWSEAELVNYLKNGVAPGKAQAAGPMAEVIEHSLRHLSDADLHAIAQWLKTTRPVHEAADSQPPYSWGNPGNRLADVRGMPLPAHADEMSGPQIYDAQCASCHQANGAGRDSGLPSLFHNTALGHANSDNLVMAILNGVVRQSDSSDVLMPAFGSQLSDIQVTTLSNYLLSMYGRPNASVSTRRVAELRTGGAASPLLAVVRFGMGITTLVVLLFAILWLSRRRRRTVSPAGVEHVK